MANTHHIGDAILHSILTRLPGKPLLRFRCVSKHWNRLISDPYFMKSRSRQMILLHWSLIHGPLVIMDNNVPAHSIVKIRYPVKKQRVHEVTSIVGTFNGIALLALYDDSLHCQLVLYNPLTRASKILVVMDTPSNGHKAIPYVFGFGYGETTRDLKIVRFQRNMKFDVFDVKTSSWSTPQQYMIIQWDFYLKDVVGVFVNGFLYWATSKKYSAILALNVKEMVFSQIKLPNGLEQLAALPDGTCLLGSKGGCLYVINSIDIDKFDVWLMKEQCDENSWMKAHSFKFGLDLGPGSFSMVFPICILGNGKILMRDKSRLLVIYDASKHSYEILKKSKTLGDLRYISGMEHVESLISPSDICFI